MKTKWNLFLVFALLVMLIGANVAPAQAQEPQTYTISGFVFNDYDGDATWDTDEPGLGSALIQLDGSCNGAEYGTPYTYSAEDGSYSFTGVPAGQSYCFLIHPISGTWLETIVPQITSLDGDMTAVNIGLTTSWLVLNPSAVPNAQLGEYYFQQFAISGGTGPITLGGTYTMPDGMAFNLDGRTLTLSGTPTESGFFGDGAKVADSAVPPHEYTWLNFQVYGNAVFNLTADPNPSAEGQMVSFTFSASDPNAADQFPFGLVTFFADGTAIEGCTDMYLNVVVVEGQPTFGNYPAVCQTSTLAAGTHAIRADFTSHSLYPGASLTLPCGQTVGTAASHCISGYLFNDGNGNGLFDVTGGPDSDSYRSGSAVHLDQHCDGNDFDLFDLWVYTGEDGSFTFSGLPDSETFCVAPYLSLGWEETTAPIQFAALTANQTGLMIGMRHIQFVLNQNIPDYDLGAVVDQSFTVTGGLAPYTIQMGEIELPPGMTWSFDDLDTLTLSGTADRIGRYFISAWYTDANGVEDEVQVTFMVRGDGDMTLVSSANPSAPGQEVTFTFTANRPDVSLPEYLSPTGTVTFSADGAAIAGSCTNIPIYFEWIETDPVTGDGYNVYRNTATCTVTLAGGSHEISAVFTANEYSPYHDATLPLTQVVQTASYSISGKVFDDLNTNGMYDTGEPGLANVPVSLYTGCRETADATVSSGTDGSYTFSGLESGLSYCVWTVAPDGYKVTLYPQIIQSLDADLTGINFGFTNLPLFSWTPAAPDEGGTATFTAVAGFMDYGWKITQPDAACGDMVTVDQLGQSVDLNFGASGSYQVCLVMISYAGWPIYDHQLVTVANVAPVPVEYSALIYPEPSEAGSPILAAEAAFYDWDHLAECTVDYGDGTGPQAGTIPLDENACAGPAHTYAAAGTYVVTFTVTDPDGATGTSSINHVVTAPVASADLSLTKTDSKDPVKPGAQLVYTLTVKNLGPNTAQTITLMDTLDRDTTYVSVSAPRGWACNYANYAVTCTGASLATGRSATIKITVTVNRTVRVGKELVNNAVVSSVINDPVLINNTVVQKTMVAK